MEAGGGNYTLNNLTGGVVNAPNTGFIQNNDGAVATFNNAGTLNKTGSSTMSIITGGGSGGTMNFSNSGTINVNAGTLIISTFGSLPSNSGTINVASGATLSIGNANVLAGSSISGAGAFVFTGAVTMPAGAFTPAGPIFVNNGNLTFNNPQQIGTLTLNVGNLSGSGDVTITSQLTDTSGGLSGSGALNIAAGATANLTTGLAPQRTINNSGTFNFPNGSSGLGGGGSGSYALNNLSGGVINAPNNNLITNNDGAVCTFSNAGTLNKTGSGPMTIFANGGSGGTMNFSNSGTVNANAGTLAVQLFNPWTNSGTMNAAGGVLEFRTAISNTGTLATSGQGVIRFSQDQFSNAGTINISGGGMVAIYSGAGPFSTIAAQIKTGYANGAWNGPGINSVAAAANASRTTGVGYAAASSLGIVGAGTFLGQQVFGSTVLIRYTLRGDANLDGQVNSSDFTRLAQNFNASGKFWSDGDSNYDGIVNSLDFNALATNFGAPLPGADVRLGSFVPEPVSLLLAATVLTVRRRRA